MPSSSSSLFQSSTLYPLSSSATTASLASSTVSVSPAHLPGYGLTLGAWIGVSVGCGVAGLITGLLVAMVFLRRRSKALPEPESEPGSEVMEVRPGSKSFDSRAFTASPTVEPAPSKAPAVSDLDQFLAIPKSDKDLAGELRSLGHLIQQHVEDNYHLSTVAEKPSSLSLALEYIGLSDTVKGMLGPEQLVSLAIEPETRHVALQHVIARVMFDSISVKSTGKLSMLPPSLSLLTRTMPPVEKHIGNPEGRPHTFIRLNPYKLANDIFSYLDRSYALAPIKCLLA